jgi:PAS domain S-box-containing protein
VRKIILPISSLPPFYSRTFFNVWAKKKQFPQYVAQEFLELTGAKVAIMVECLVDKADPEFPHQHRILATVPQRRTQFSNQSHIQGIINLLHAADEIKIWDPAEPGEHVKLLNELDVGVSMAIPLIAGKSRAGGIILLDLASVERIDQVRSVFRTISSVVALALRSALLFEYQEKRLQEQSQSLHEYRQALQAFFDNHIVGMVQMDKQGQYSQANQRWAEMTGYTKEELLRMHLGDLTHPEDVEGNALARLARGEITSFERRKRFVRKDGETLWGHIAGTAIFDEQGEFDGLVLLITDITAYKQEEQKRQELEEEIRQKYKMEAVGVMAGGIAHNFNNNLAIMLGNLEMLELKLQQAGLGGYIENARTAVLRSRDLVAQIMTYSRKEGRKMSFVNPHFIIEETVNLLRSTLPATIDLSFKNLSGPENYGIIADPGQIQEALLNICNNAVHAMDEEGVLRIALNQEDVALDFIPDQYECSAGKYVRLDISDTGCGMDSATRHKIFDPFFTTKEVGKGTGMGLATVHGIVMQHHGFILLKSRPGEGSCFSLYFPGAYSDQGTENSQETAELHSGTAQILFVDDDPIVADLGQMMLEEMGHQVVICTDALEALKLFSANPSRFDLVITDQTMPELTGDKFIEALKHLRPDVLTILCTGYSSKISVETASERGIDAFLMKPISMQDLSETISLVLEKA